MWKQKYEEEVISKSRLQTEYNQIVEKSKGVVSQYLQAMNNLQQAQIAQRDSQERLRGLNMVIQERDSAKSEVARQQQHFINESNFLKTQINNLQSAVQTYTTVLIRSIYVSNRVTRFKAFQLGLNQRSKNYII